MKFRSLALALSGGVLSAACTHSGGSAAVSGMGVSSYDVNKYAVNKLACFPVGSGTSQSDPNQGLQASVFYLSSSQPRYSDVADMIANGHLSDTQAFFNSINVPERIFTQGFPLQTGGMIKDDAGNDLTQYFALRFTGSVQLGANDVEGDYQLGIISDDGAVWSLSESGANNYSIVVNNDGTHSAQMGCGPIVHMTKSTHLDMRLDYYQGPANHIALVPLWRKVDSSSPTEPQCGKSGIKLFWDPDNNSAPLAAYTGMLARGWKPLDESNYAIPQAADYNPCTSGTAPVISNLLAVSILDGSYAVLWSTDIAATDQVMYTDSATGVQQLTVSDNVLRLSHTVRLSGLISGHTYSLQAISVSSDLGKTLSPAVSITVP